MTTPVTKSQLLLCLFFLSGVAALIYQICWQRLLFSWFGVDIESVTIIVSIFMLGLGLGALAGGHLADHLANRLIILFCGLEAAIGIFGAISPTLIKNVGLYFSAANHLTLFVIAFLILIIPTSLMGASLPILVAHINKTTDNIGISIGSLYFSNTLGAAFGSLATGLIVFIYLTLNEAVYLAASINILIAAIILIGWRKNN